MNHRIHHPVKAALFDLDGIFVDAEPDFAAVLNRVAH